LVREIGRGRDVEERSLEMTEVSREGGRRWCRQESGLQILWKKERESLSRNSCGVMYWMLGTGDVYVYIHTYTSKNILNTSLWSTAEQLSCYTDIMTG